MSILTWIILIIFSPLIVFVFAAAAAFIVWVNATLLGVVLSWFGYPGLLNACLSGSENGAA